MRYTFLLVLLATTTAKAATCGSLNTNDYLKNCKNIYTATLVESKLVKDERESLSYVVGRFSQPIDILKGGAKDGRKIRTVMNGTSAEGFLIVGLKYLICDNEEEVLEKSSCGYTSTISGRANFVYAELYEKRK